MKKLALFLTSAAVFGGGKLDVLTSKHNLAVSGPGPVTSQEGEVCIFCHTPHSSYVDVKPLWDHTLSVQTYNTYTSSTYNAAPGTPSAGTSKVCLSCHDGTVALGQTVSRGLIQTSGAMQSSDILGSNLSSNHPVSFKPVDDGQLASTLFQNPPATLDPAVRLAAGQVECTSCHNPHSERLDAAAQKFLVRPNNGGALCLACHAPSRTQPNKLNGWTTGAHAVATNSVPISDQFGPYGTVSANACTNCHGTHSSGSSPRLLAAPEEATCFGCHAGANASPPLLNIKNEFSKSYTHPTITVANQHDAAESITPINAGRHAECPDCHNTHAASGSGTATAPAVEPALSGASGFAGAGGLQPAANEFEVCFKCHADSTNKPQNSAGYSTYGFTAVRVTNTQVPDPYNERLKFGSTISRHNVSNPRMRTGAQVPSLRGSMLNLNGSSGLPIGNYVYCTDCHANDQARKVQGSGPNGPHGSNWTHLLERRYDQEAPLGGGAPYVGGINGSAGTCNKCHDVANSILQDRSFSKHAKHVGDEHASCSTCHDPHGIPSGNVVNNYALINFDTRVVGASSGGILSYQSSGAGTFHGRCYLRCHGQDHNPKSY